MTRTTGAHTPETLSAPAASPLPLAVPAGSGSRADALPLGMRAASAAPSPDARPFVPPPTAAAPAAADALAAPAAATAAAQVVRPTTAGGDITAPGGAGDSRASTQTESRDGEGTDGPIMRAPAAPTGSSPEAPAAPSLPRTAPAGSGSVADAPSLDIHAASLAPPPDADARAFAPPPVAFAPASAAAATQVVRPTVDGDELTADAPDTAGDSRASTQTESRDGEGADGPIMRAPAAPTGSSPEAPVFRTPAAESARPAPAAAPPAAPHASTPAVSENTDAPAGPVPSTERPLLGTTPPAEAEVASLEVTRPEVLPTDARPDVAPPVPSSDPGSSLRAAEPAAAGAAHAPAHVAGPRSPFPLAWLDALPTASSLTADGWQTAEIRLDGGEGTVEVSARRDGDDRVAVTVAFSEPTLTTRPEADALRARLEAAYGTQVDLSFADGRSPRQKDAPAPDRAAPAPPTAPASADAPDSPPPVRPRGPREWIG